MQESAMLVHPRSAVSIAAAIFFLATPATSGKNVEDRDWIEVRTENFRVRSDMREKDAIELIRYLELFRVAVSAITNISSTDSAIPTNIYAMRSSRDFKSLGLDPRDFAGIFVPGQRDNLILMRDARGMNENATILHEYVHFLINNHNALIYPRWFNEGFAEYLSAIRLSRGNFEVGRFPEHRKSAFLYVRWIPMRKIISAENYDDWRDEDQHMFYAEAWALVNYLQNRPGQGASFSQHMAEYIALTDSGKSDIEAFEEAFSMTMMDINQKVRSHVERGRFTVFRMKSEELLPVFEPEVVKLSRQQVSLYLAQAAFRLGELDRAEAWLKIAVTDPKTRAQAEAGLGDVLKFRGDYVAAEPHFENAVALAPDDPYCQLDIAEYWHTRAIHAENEEKRKEFTSQARAHYVKAWKLDDSMPEIYANYGTTFLLGDQDLAKAIEMLEEAEFLLPSDMQIRISLAEAYAGAGRLEDATRKARSVLAWSHYNEDLVEWAAKLTANPESNEDQAEVLEDADVKTAQ